MLDNFDKILIINLDRRKDRWAMAMAELKQFIGANIERVPAIDHLTLSTLHSKKQTAQVACTMSHLAALKKLQAAGPPLLGKFHLILEDDFHIAKGVCLDGLPLRWDMCFLGVNEHSPQLAQKTTAADLYRSFGATYTSHAYLVHHEFVPRLVDIVENHIKQWLTTNLPETPAIDVIYSYVAKEVYNHVYYMKPAAITQTPGLWSDIEFKQVDYSAIIM